MISDRENIHEALVADHRRLQVSLQNALERAERAEAEVRALRCELDRFKGLCTPFAP